MKMTESATSSRNALAIHDCHRPPMGAYIASPHEVRIDSSDVICEKSMGDSAPGLMNMVLCGNPAPLVGKLQVVYLHFHMTGRGAGLGDVYRTLSRRGKSLPSLIDAHAVETPCTMSLHGAAEIYRHDAVGILDAIRSISTVDWIWHELLATRPDVINFQWPLAARLVFDWPHSSPGLLPSADEEANFFLQYVRTLMNSSEKIDTGGKKTANVEWLIDPSEHGIHKALHECVLNPLSGLRMLAKETGGRVQFYFPGSILGMSETRPIGVIG